MYVRSRLQLATAIRDQDLDKNEVPRDFGSSKAALKWALEYLTRSYGMSRPNILHTPPRYRESHAGTVTHEDLQDLAYTITSALGSCRPKPALIVRVLCGDDDGGRWNNAADMLADQVRSSIDTNVPRVYLRSLAVVALQKHRQAVLKIKKRPVPRRAFAEAVGIRRQSAQKKKWTVAINAIEETVQEWTRQGFSDLESVLEKKRIVR